MKEMILKLWKDEEGPTAVEYGVMLTLITVAIIGAVTTLSGNLTALFSRVAGYIS